MRYTFVRTLYSGVNFSRLCTQVALISLVRAIVCVILFLTIFTNKCLFKHCHCSGPKKSDLSQNFQKLQALELLQRGFFEHKFSIIGLYEWWWCCLNCPLRCHRLLSYVQINPKAGQTTSASSYDGSRHDRSNVTDCHTYLYILPLILYLFFFCILTAVHFYYNCSVVFLQASIGVRKNTEIYWSVAE